MDVRPGEPAKDGLAGELGGLAGHFLDCSFVDRTARPSPSKSKTLDPVARLEQSWFWTRQSTFSSAQPSGRLA